ncbi:NADH-quinone oxidoreductase [Anopheles sinensis]|uniref:NADH-quinone oxidoreductase n=1 Tax=Anopheles sinensis TaxID=74873 RepID=A0A084VR18_ANOSI|nr:NADH-quinone oxidoreductase [Anopheles sinensis]
MGIHKPIPILKFTNELKKFTEDQTGKRKMDHGKVINILMELQYLKELLRTDRQISWTDAVRKQRPVSPQRTVKNNRTCG